MRQIGTFFVALTIVVVILLLFMSCAKQYDTGHYNPGYYHYPAPSAPPSSPGVDFQTPLQGS